MPNYNYYVISYDPILNTVNEVIEETLISNQEIHKLLNQNHGTIRYEYYPQKNQAKDRIKELQEKPKNENIELLKDLLLIANNIIQTSGKINLANPGIPTEWINEPSPDQMIWLISQITNNFQLTFKYSENDYQQTAERIIKKLQNFIEESKE